MAENPGNAGDTDAQDVIELLGTRGCHLCDEAEVMLRNAAKAARLEWRYVDIAAFGGNVGDNAGETTADDMLQRYAERIPVLRRRNQELGWPFSLLDIIRFVRAGQDGADGGVSD